MIQEPVHARVRRALFRVGRRCIGDWILIRWILFGSGLVYLLVRYFAREEAEAEAEAPAVSELTSMALARGAPVERELVAAGR
jgi:hypothetical protein